MQLRPEPFALIATGVKTIEGRLYDEKRQLLQLGDVIQFTNTETGEVIAATITGLLRYATFESMFTAQGVRRFGFDDEAPVEAAAMMRRYYDDADERQYGVLGIQLDLIV